MTTPAPPTPGRDDAPRLRGEAVYLYAFDVANEVRLAAVPALLSARPATFALRADRTAPRAVPFSRPLSIEPASPATALAGRPVRLLVRVYEVGVVSVTARVGFDAAALPELLPLRTPVLDDGRPLDALAREVCETVRGNLAAALVRPGPGSDPEAYTAFVLDPAGKPDAGRWLAGCRREAAGLLAGTPPDRLSDEQADEVLRLRRSFTAADLVVVDWDAALVVAAGGAAEDVLFVLELANLQLEEFRWLDRALDARLEAAYADLGRRGWGRFGAASRVLGALCRLRVDFTRLADEVTHTTKFVGDWHLARVYLLARERFHLDQWRASVEQRLGQLDQLYTLVRELYDRRMLGLEVVIVLFIAAELLLGLLRR